jgi:hypothetical protein
MNKKVPNGTCLIGKTFERKIYERSYQHICIFDNEMAEVLVFFSWAAADGRYATQVPVKPDGLPEPQVSLVTPSTTRERFTLPKKLICMNTNGSYTAETHQVTSMAVVLIHQV